MQLKHFDVTHRTADSMMGAHSTTWRYQDNAGREVIVSLDFPFTVYHPLEVCYISTGSKVLNEIREFELNTETGLDYVSEAHLLDQLGDQSHLTFTQFNVKGESANRIDVFSLETFFNKGLLRKSIGSLFQLQLLVHDVEKLTEQEQQRYQQLVLEAKKYLLPRVQELHSRASGSDSTSSAQGG